MTRDTRIVKYNVDFCYKGYKFSSGCIAIDLSDITNMQGKVIAEWSKDYTEKHLRALLGEATGISGGWSFPLVTIKPSGFDNKILVYEFDIVSRLYCNLRRIYERPTRK